MLKKAPVAKKSIFHIFNVLMFSKLQFYFCFQAPKKNSMNMQEKIFVASPTFANPNSWSFARNGKCPIFMKIFYFQLTKEFHYNRNNFIKVK